MRPVQAMPLLPLDILRKKMGYNPWLFWGFSHSTLVPENSAANKAIRQESWQDASQVGRSDMLDAIYAAEEKLRGHLLYGPAPRYIEEEVVSYPRPVDARLQYGASIGADGRWLSIQLQEHYIQAVGVEALTLQGEETVTYEDLDGDGIKESFYVSIIGQTIALSEIAIYFKESDRTGDKALSDRWRIQPATVSYETIGEFDSTVIRGSAWLLGKPLLYEGVATRNLDPTTTSNYVTSVMVYRRYTSGNGTTAATSQAKLIWETAPYPGWATCCGGASDSSTDPAALAEAIARVGIRDARHGIVTPGEAAYNATTGIWSASAWGSCLQQPSRVIVRYLAGYPLRNRQMDPLWQEVVCYLAAAEMAERPAWAETANKWLAHWQFDMARAAGSNDEQYSLSQGDLDNPFGTRRGQVMAWKKVRNLMHVRGFLP